MQEIDVQKAKADDCDATVCSGSGFAWPPHRGKCWSALFNFSYGLLRVVLPLVERINLKQATLFFRAAQGILYTDLWFCQALRTWQEPTVPLDTGKRFVALRE